MRRPAADGRWLKEDNQPSQEGRRPLAKGAAKVSAHQLDRQDHTRPGDREAGRLALARLRCLDEHLRAARLAHAAMPLTRYYSRPLLDVPLGRLQARGRWAA